MKQMRGKSIVSLLKDRPFSALLVVSLLTVMGFSYTMGGIYPPGPYPPFQRPAQQHWGFPSQTDLPIGEERGTAWFVDAITGLDTNSGLDWGSPFRTIQKAINEAFDGEGDYIFVARGDYTGPYLEFSTLVPKSNLHIVGEGAGLTKASGFHLRGASHVEITGFTLIGGEDPDFFWPPLNAISIVPAQSTPPTYSTHNYIHDNEFRMRGDTPLDAAAVYLHEAWFPYYPNSVGNNKFVHNIMTDPSYFAGFYLENGVQNATIDGNYIQADGVGLHIGGCKNCDIVNNHIISSKTYPGMSEGPAIMMGSLEFSRVTGNMIEIHSSAAQLLTGSAISSAGNTFSDNHWNYFSRYVAVSPEEIPGELNVIQDVGIPRSGKVNVRLILDQADFPSGTVFILRLKDCANNGLLGFSEMTTGVTNAIYPDIEIPISGGLNQFDVTLSYTKRPTTQTVLTVDIIDS